MEIMNESNDVAGRDAAAKPVTVRVETPTGIMVVIPSLSEEDVFLNLRECLATTHQACHFTCYGLKMVKNGSESGEMINDFTQLGTLPELVGGKVHIRMVKRFYKLRDVRQHVCRIRKILADPPKNFGNTFPKPDVPENKTAGSSLKQKPKTFSSSESKAKAKNNNRKVAAKASSSKADEKTAQKKIPKLIIHQSPAGPVLMLSKEALKQEANRRKKKAANLKSDIQIPVPIDPQDVMSISYSYMSPTLGSTAAECVTNPHRPCVHSICFSGFNPPPQQRCMLGDLQYLEIKVLEGTTFHVTGCSAGFFVNSTRNECFNPAPAMYAYHSNTLLELLKKASPKFNKYYEALLHKASANCIQEPQDLSFLCTPWKTLTSIKQLGSQISWLGLPQPPAHKLDLNRAEDHIRGVGYVGDDEVAEQMRDWNDDYQTCREMPVSTLQERISRQRAMRKIVSDFVEMAEKGARAVMQGDVPPINPADDEQRRIYILNNIFYSLALDTRGTYTGAGEERVAHKLAKLDLLSIKEVNKVDTPGLCTLPTVVLDYLGHRVVAQGIIPGIFQVSKACRLIYGSIDRGNTIHNNVEMHAIMKKAMERLCHRGSCVVARGIEDEEQTLPSTINSNAEDRAGTDPVSLYGPVECKGILGSDTRFYVLDLVRVTPKDMNFDESDYPDNFTAVLRPELLWLYNKHLLAQHQKLKKKDAKAKAQVEAKAKVEATEDKKSITSAASSEPSTNKAADNSTDPLSKQPSDEATKQPTETQPAPPVASSPDAAAAAPTKADTCSAAVTAGEAAAVAPTAGAAAAVTKTENSNEDEAAFKSVRFDVNVFTQHKLGLEPEELKARQADILALCKFLRTHAIPSLVSDINRGGSTCVDGQTLVEAMHAHGVNIRYLGEVAALTSRICIKNTVPYICEIEMITRALKEYISEVFQSRPELRCAPATFIVRLLNCILGFESGAKTSTTTASPEGLKRKTSGEKISVSPARTLADTALNAMGPLTSTSLWTSVKQLVKSKYRHDLVLVDYGGDKIKGAFLRLQLLRRICQKLGLVLRARSYDIPRKQPLQLGDLLDIRPVTKNCLSEVPLAEAHKELDVGRIYTATGNVQRAYIFVEQAIVQLYQVCGAESKDTFRAYQMLAAILSRAGDSTAVLQQRRAAALSEHLFGLDHPTTADAIGNLAHLQKIFGDSESAVINFRRAIRLLDLAGGPTNHEAGVLYKQMGSVYQDAGHHKLAIKCFQETLKRHSADARSRVHVLRLIAECYNRDGAHKEACQALRHSKPLLEQLTGRNSAQVKEANNRLKHFTQLLVSATRIANAKADAIKVRKLEDKKKSKRKRNRKRKKIK